ncbi:Hsp20/alpha crystallin family protein [Paludisphaera mucosa]|uniref:Hsp20/alpha crystallin family protein n=1 Tax=Paludisphaera mucosa TaxID=3030827 RepID=A0ABT6FGL9_9BACT|nr:Hsp20/alpha crystallin family protein [Paludisphaera mucosa]MDG3006695.1 Hsp20/alpha crystallin family protein [Paludisphaera mucosa]
MEALFGRYLGEGSQAKALNRSGGDPLPLSLWSDEGWFHIEVDLPGVELKDVDVSIHKDVLTIKAQRAVVEERRYAYNGRTFGRFERSLTLPESVDSESVDARLADGVLHLTLRKRPEAHVRKVEIRQD